MLERVRSNFSGLTVVDKMMLGSGVPKNWLSAVFLVIGEVAKLEEGEAVMKETDFSVSGFAADAGTAKMVTESLRKGLPDNFGSSENIKVLKRPESEDGPKAQPALKPEKTIFRGDDNTSPRVFYGLEAAFRVFLKPGMPNGKRASSVVMPERWRRHGRHGRMLASLITGLQIDRVVKS